MGPACAVVDAREDRATLWTGSQKPHFARDGVARALGLPQDKVHGIWVPGPGSYGRNDAGDAGIDAALLSKAVGRPGRVQGMRWEGHGSDPKGPASIHRARAALDGNGAVTGYVFESKDFSRIDIDTNESDHVYSLAGVPAESYGFANKQLAGETMAPLPKPLRRCTVPPMIPFNRKRTGHATRRQDARSDAGKPARLADRSLEAVAAAHGVNIRKPGGSHVVFEHSAVAEALSVPARRPIKPVYVRRFVAFIEAVRASNE